MLDFLQKGGKIRLDILEKLEKLEILP
jgi:hypothetical protein